jgi:hypothetical protein
MNGKLLSVGLCVWAAVLGLENGARAQTVPEAANVAPGIASVSVKEAQPNQAVSVTLKNVAKGTIVKVVMLGGGSETSVGNPLTVPDDKTITFNVPAGLALGTYRVRVEVGGFFYLSDAINVIRSFGTKATLVKIDPKVIYAPGDTIDLALTGTDFYVKDKPEVNQILFDGDPQVVAWDGCDEKDRQKWDAKQTNEIHGSVADDGEHIYLCNVPVKKQADVLIAVKQGPQITETKRLSTYLWTQWEIILASLAVVGVALLLVIFLMCFKKGYRIKNQEYGFFRALFLDPETDTYSLSKYQFYMWTGAALFTYAYLVICKMFVQGASLPDVPSNLPAIVGIGAGTAIGAQVITNVKGPKGAGEELPSLSDFVTSGGVAAPERVQMFLWTTFGVLAFAIAAAKVSPAEVKGVPQVPETLMYLMGLSSAGYLGGKLARKPGPVINEISTSPSQPDDQAGIVLAPTKAASLDQPVAAAQAALTSVKTSLASAAQPPAAAAVQAANDAVVALNRGVSAAQAFAKNGDVGGVVDAMNKAAADADVAARQAAQEFDRLSISAPPDRGTASARDAAQAAQETAAAAQRLATAVAAQLSVAQSNQQQAQRSDAGNAVRVIELRGRNLSADATFEISDQELPFRMLKNSDDEHAPEIVAKEDDQSLANMGRALRLTIAVSELDDVDRKVYTKWFGTKGALSLTIINPDGQKSVISFNLPPGAEQSKTTSGTVPAPSQAAGG